MATVRKLRQNFGVVAEAIEALPTLCVGQADDLKIERPGLRVWISRCGVADGMCCKGHITVEKLRDGKWRTVAEVHGDETLDDDES